MKKFLLLVLIASILTLTNICFCEEIPDQDGPPSENPPEDWWPGDWPIPPQIPPEDGNGAIPEPSAMLMFGFAGMALYSRRKK